MQPYTMTFTLVSDWWREETTLYFQDELHNRNMAMTLMLNMYKPSF